MGFSKQEYWSGLPFSSPGGLLDSGIKTGSPALQADSLPLEPPEKTKSSTAQCKIKILQKKKKKDPLDALRKSYLTFNVEKRQKFKKFFLKINFLCFVKKKKEEAHIK